MLLINKHGRQLVEANYAPLASFGLALTALAVPTLLKLAIDAWLINVPPFLTYFPAITIASLGLGARWGVIVLIAATIISNYLFIGDHGWSMSKADLVLDGLFLAAGGLIVTTASTLRNAAAQLRDAAERERHLNMELKHRVQNSLTVVNALAHQTARRSRDVSGFCASFSRRIGALSEAHNVLSVDDWASTELTHLVEQGLKPFLSGGAIEVSGEACRVQGSSCIPLMMALHELATNALKYGALSVPEGRVTVCWTVDVSRIVLTWSEERGPPVVAPKRRGLGSRLLTAQSGLEAVDLRFLSGGVTCTLTLPRG